jgi:pSer/pThr/pTyr-binding forkhead associated (FHA) protein
MSAVLISTKDKKQLANVPLTGSRFTVGRSPKCNLPVDEPLASRQHVEITCERGLFWVQDLGSRNGTLLNGEKISERRQLKDGDEITIGATQLKFVQDDDEGATRAASPQDSGKGLGRNIPERKEKGPLQVKLKVADGPLQGGVFKDWEGPLLIGRALDNHVVLVDDAVSTHHALIEQEGGRYYIKDLDSANGTFLNGVKIQRAELSNGHKIRAGVSTLVFEVTDLRKARRNLNIALIAVILFAGIVVAVKLWPDPAGQHIQAALRWEAQGNLPNALTEFQLARGIAPGRSEAQIGCKRIQDKIQAEDMLKKAEAAAEAEDYDGALGVVYRVERIDPENARAAQLEAVIKSIGEAKIALDHHIWQEAVAHLEKAQETPNSKLIVTRLEQAKKELAAERSLSDARDAFEHEQWDKAKVLLSAIPATSLYANEAAQYLGRIDQQEKTAAALSRAKTLYQKGQLTGTLSEIDAGLKVKPDSAPLLQLQKQARLLAGLYDSLNSAEGLKEGDDLDLLLQARKACGEVLQTETDPLNALVIRAKDTQNRIGQWLQNLSQTYTDKAQNLLQSSTAHDSATRREALRLFTLAAKADGNNQTAAQAAKSLHHDIVQDCEMLEQKGERYVELGLLNEARNYFRQVIDNALPEDKCYRLAKDQLSKLK